jgi:hypothetical protein
MKATLFFLGMSIFLMQSNTFIILYWKENQSVQWDAIVSGYTSQTMEKIGIMIDMAGLLVALINKRQYPAKDTLRYKKFIYIGLGVSIFLTVLLQFFLSYFKVLYQNHIDEDPSYANTDNGKMQLATYRGLQIAYSLISNTIILIGYPVIFCYRERIYDQALDPNECPENKRIFAQQKRSLVIQCLFICLMYLYRDVREILFMLS